MNTLRSLRIGLTEHLSGIRRQRWKRRIQACLAGVFLAMLCTAVAGAATDEKTGVAVSHAYAQVDDLRIYYEARGAGEPIFMLHGAFGSTALWAACAEELAQHFLVITPDGRGRGRTGDGEGPISPGRTARDVIGLMDHLGLRQVHVVGHSAGSLTAINMLIDYPDRVRSATLVGSPFMALAQPNDALRKLGQEVKSFDEGRSEDAELKQFAEQWRSSAPDPSRFRVMMEKLSRVTEAIYSGAALSTINRPVLVIKAGRDKLIPPESFDKLAAAIPGSKLADFPDGTHGLPRQEPSRLAMEIQNFIHAQPQPRK